MGFFDGKKVLVTGASEGIGRATATEFAKAGADLILVARSRDRLEALARELESQGRKIEVHCLDLTMEDKVEALFNQISDFDVAVNNAGTEGTIKNIEELSLQNYDEVFNLNVRALFQCLQRQVHHFREGGKAGSIVNVSSILGIRGIAGSSLYVASKHAVLGLTRAVALEQINHHIRVNCVSPGSTDTPMIRRILGDPSADFVGVEPSRRMATPTEIAEGILWLSSDSARHIVGHNLVIDGGRTVGV